MDLNVDPDQTGYLAYDSLWGDSGTWNDIKNGTNRGAYVDDKWYYVLYCPGYEGNDPAYFQTHDFYFRGFAVPNTDPASPDYMNQDYTIINLLSTTKLQQF